MEVPITHIEKLFETGEFTRLQFDLSDMKFANSFKVSAGSIQFQSFIDSDYLRQIKERKIDKVAVCLPKPALNFMRNIFQKSYPNFQFEDKLDIIKRRLELINKLNSFSGFQRKLLIKQEIVYIDAQTGKEKIALPLGSELNDKAIAKMETLISKEETIQYSYNEEGILVFISDPIKNMMLKIDILALLSQTNYPIIFCDTIDEALNKYRQNHPKLVIGTQLEKSWETKSLFLECYNNDVFNKFLNFDESPTRNRGVALAQVNFLYNDDYEAALQEHLIEKNKIKNNLDGKMRNPLMDKIEFIRQNYNKKNFIELKYYLHKIGKTYNVKTMVAILDKIEQ